MDKKMIKVIGIVAGVFVVIILLLFVIAACSKKRFVFDKFQDTMISAAKEYYKDNPKELPNENGKTKKVSLKQLINDGYMKEPAETYKDETLVCDGSIIVTNNDGFYLYSPSVTCGKDHRTQYFKDKLLDDSLVEEGPGLHKDSINYIVNETDVLNPKYKEVYVYKGEVKNNYVKFQSSDKLFRILRINEDNTIRLMEEKCEDTAVWDDRFNSEKENLNGINDYVINGSFNSRIKDTINDYYNDSSVWNDTMKSYIVNQGLCIGKRGEEDATKNGSTECTVGILDQRLGLLAVYEYLQASLDNNCNSTEAVGCLNFNWLADYDRIWTITATKENTYTVWYLDQTIESRSASSLSYWNVVFNISDKVTYVSGSGTQEDPYIIK